MPGSPRGDAPALQKCWNRHIWRVKKRFSQQRLFPASGSEPSITSQAAPEPRRAGLEAAQSPGQWSQARGGEDEGAGRWDRGAAGRPVSAVLQAEPWGSRERARAWRWGKPEPPVGHSQAPGPTEPGGVSRVSSSGPSPGMGVGRGNSSPSPPGGNLDGRRFHVKNVFTGICHHLQKSLYLHPFFFPLTATRPEGCVHAGAIEKQRLGLFCSSS